MRFLIWLVVIAGLLWGGWWFVAARGAETAGGAVFDGLRAEGFAAQNAGVSVQGFPNRLDMTIDAPTFASRDGRMGWSADFAQILSLSYKPWHLIGVVSPQQRLTLQGQSFTLDSPRFRVSLLSRPSPDLPLERFALEAEPLAVTQGQTAVISAAKVNLASRIAPDLAQAHDIGLRIDALRLPLALAGLPDVVETLLIEAQVALSAPLDRHAATTRPQATSVTLRNLQLRWGEVRLHGDGHITPGPAGLMRGEITLRVTNWRDLVPVLVETGVIAPDFRPNLEAALTFLSRRDPDGAEVLTLPLRMANGAMTLGPLPLGPAPAFPRW